MATNEDDAPPQVENDALTYVADRLTILRSAYSALKSFGITPDVGDILEVASWLAGDEQPNYQETGTIVGIYTGDDDDDDSS